MIFIGVSIFRYSPCKKEKNFRGYENAEYLLQIASYVKCTHWQAQDALTDFCQQYFSIDDTQKFTKPQIKRIY